MFPGAGAVEVVGNRGRFVGAVSLFLFAIFCPLPADEPAYMQLRINEIIANNGNYLADGITLRGVEPQNWNCKYVDMIELYNPTNGQIDLTGFWMTDGNSYYKFPKPQGSSHYINPRSRFVIFCDDEGFDDDRGTCSITQTASRKEAHANFKLDKDGETITLLSPDFEVIDEVAYPPLSANVSYARFPDGADNWVFCPKNSDLDDFTSFGVCLNRTNPDSPFICYGAQNTAGANLSPRISLDDYSTNTPNPGQAVWIIARVKDDLLPGEEDIERVEIAYRLDGGEEEIATMGLLEIRTNVDNPLDRWSLWEGEIPGQPEGTVVDFHLHVVDRHGGESTEPTRLCEYPGEPCRFIRSYHLEGQDCVRVESLPPGCTAECQIPYRYLVGPPSGGPLVINEVVAENQRILEDKTEETKECSVLENIKTLWSFCHFDDFLELYNGSDVDMDLSGLVLSAKPFHPEDGWVFPAGSSIPAGEYLIVWVDGDGDFRCGPDPNNPGADPPEFHTDFNVDGRSDEVFLFEPFQKPGGSGETLYRVLDGLRWGMRGEPIDEHGTFISLKSRWKMYKGRQEPPLLVDLNDAQIKYPWTEPRYSESGWIEGDAPFGYGLGNLATELDDMPSGYLTAYFRKRFTVPDSLFEVLGRIPGTETDVIRLLVKRLFLEFLYDDGFRVYLNGELVATRNLPVPETDSVLEITEDFNTRYVRLTRTHDLPAREEIDPSRAILDITGAKDLLLKGPNANMLAIEVHNASLESPDFLFDARLFWGVEGLGNDESLSRIPSGSREGIVLNVSKFCETLDCKKEYATPGEPNRSPVLFRRGDAGWPPDGQVNIGDAIAIVWALFSSPPASFCWEAADTDNSGGVDLTDGILVLEYLFRGGVPPSSPGPFQCGPDEGTPTADCDYPLGSCF